jgi:YVTN family beta-propeller protein
VQKIDMTPVDLVITKDGKTAYVTLGHAGRLAVVNVRARTVRDYIPIGLRSSGLAMASDENTLYVADSFGGALHLVDVKSHKVTGSIPLDRTPSGVVIDDSPARGTGVGRGVASSLPSAGPRFRGADE